MAILIDPISGRVGDRHSNNQITLGCLRPPGNLVGINTVSHMSIEFNWDYAPAIIGRMSRFVFYLETIGIQMRVSSLPATDDSTGRVGFDLKFEFGFDRVDQDDQFWQGLAWWDEATIAVESLQREPIFTIGFCLKWKFLIVRRLSIMKPPGSSSIFRQIELDFDERVIVRVDVERDTESVQVGGDFLNTGFVGELLCCSLVLDGWNA